MQKWKHTLQIVRLPPVGKIFDLARKEELASISLVMKVTQDTMSSPYTTPLASSLPIQSVRLERLQRELRFAWSQLSRDDVLTWGKASSMGFADAAGRRVKNLAHLAKSSVIFGGKEALSGYYAWSESRLKVHLQNRASDASDSIRQTGRTVSEFVSQFADAFKADPADAGVQLLTLVVTSLAVSGGPDGNGGAPDLDLMAGIDAHRSLLSHSILMGAALEAAILSLLGVVQMTYSKLPAHHDSLWDSLHGQASKLSVAASVGVGIGMAYHLLVDGLLQPAPYHDLPVAMPIEAHQSIFVVNSLGEAVDLGKKRGG